MLYVTGTLCMHWLYVVRPCTTKIVLRIVLHLILAIFVLHREWVNLAIVSAWHLVLWISLLKRQRYIIVSLSSDKCTCNCKSLWIKASAKRPTCTSTYVYISSVHLRVCKRGLDPVCGPVVCLTVVVRKKRGWLWQVPRCRTSIRFLTLHWTPPLHRL